LIVDGGHGQTTIVPALGFGLWAFGRPEPRVYLR
jgi:hypothetical protein